MNAISLSSGDHAGMNSSAGFFVTCESAPVFASTTQMS